MNKDQQFQGLKRELPKTWLWAVLTGSLGLWAFWGLLHASSWLEGISYTIGTVFGSILMFASYQAAMLSDAALKASRRTPIPAIMTVSVKEFDTGSDYLPSANRVPDVEYLADLEVNNTRWTLTLCVDSWVERLPCDEIVHVLAYTDLRDRPVLLETATDYICLCLSPARSSLKDTVTNPLDQ